VELQLLTLEAVLVVFILLERLVLNQVLEVQEELSTAVVVLEEQILAVVAVVVVEKLPPQECQELAVLEVKAL
jgi:hypothetical protein